MERLEEIIEQRQIAKGNNSSGQKYNSYGEDYGGEIGGSDEEPIEPGSSPYPKVPI